MDDLSLSDNFSLGSAICLRSYLSRLVQVWNNNSSSETSDTSALSKNNKAVLDKLASVEQMLHILLGQSGASTYSSIDSDHGPEKKKVSSCPPR